MPPLRHERLKASATGVAPRGSGHILRAASEAVWRAVRWGKRKELPGTKEVSQAKQRLAGGGGGDWRLAGQKTGLARPKKKKLMADLSKKKSMGDLQSKTVGAAGRATKQKRLGNRQRKAVGKQKKPLAWQTKKTVLFGLFQQQFEHSCLPTSGLEHAGHGGEGRGDWHRSREGAPTTPSAVWGQEAPKAPAATHACAPQIGIGLRVPLFVCEGTNPSKMHETLDQQLR